MTNFGVLRNKFLSNRQLPIFSFLSIDTLRLYDSDLVSGVVAYNGMMLDGAGRSDFDITKGDDYFRVNLNVNYDSPPTVLAFPNWLGASSEDYPQFIGELNFAIGAIDTTSFEIRHTSPQSYLGFNFAVIGPDMDTTNVKHGVIFECTDENAKTSSTHGIAVNTADESCDGLARIVGDNHPGVKIDFDSPTFSDIPSVIVTPYVYEAAISAGRIAKNVTVVIQPVGVTEPATPPTVYEDLLYEGWIPKCIVESITRTSARVKCGMVAKNAVTKNAAGAEIDPISFYLPIPFTFIAVGNAEVAE